MLGSAQPGVDEHERVLRAHEKAVVRAVWRLGFGTNRGRELVRIDIVEDEVDDGRTSTITEQRALALTGQQVDLLHWTSVNLAQGTFVNTGPGLSVGRRT